MNGYATPQELPELNDEQIEILDAICKDASKSLDAPFKALIRAYEEYFERNGLDTARDNVILRWLMRVCEIARRQYRTARPTNFVPYLRSILEAHGITVIDDGEDGEAEGYVRSLEEPSPARRQEGTPNRRVSFNDAHLEETWMSERSRYQNPNANDLRDGMLKQPARRARDFAATPRARSVSSERPHGLRQPAPKHFQEASPSEDHISEFEDHHNPALYLQPSQTELENNAAAILATTDLRHARNCLHIWHDKALVSHHQHAQAWAFAAAHDRHALLRQSYDVLRTAFSARGEENARDANLQRILDSLMRKHDASLVGKAFSHWHASASYQWEITTTATNKTMKRKYFNRWRAIAIENATKARSLLSQKYLALWRDKTARRQLALEQADAHHEETLMRKCYQRWFWKFCGRRVEGWNQTRVERRALHSWANRLYNHHIHEYQAADAYDTHLAQSAMRSLVLRLSERRQANTTAENHFGRKQVSVCLQTLRITVKLKPLTTTLSLKINLNLERKAFRVWHLHLTLTRQAAEVDRKRILQSAWTNWNDSLRCRVLAQRIDERLLMESLYKWVLQTRMHTFRRELNAKLARRILATWNSKRRQTVVTLEQAEANFTSSQRWRRLKFGMLRLNIAQRNREDAERAAIEFSNSRTLPDVLEVWKQRSEHARLLAKWAADARFYCLCTKTLKVWSERTTEHQHQRRRDAYAQVRAKIKIRIVKDCFSRWRTKSVEVSSMREEAEQRARARTFEAGMDAFDTWRDKTSYYADLEVRAVAADQQKLLTAALSSFVNYHADLEAMGQQALLHKQESDLGLLASAFKRVQWATFTAARRLESADALRARNRDQHIKQMLRHWSSQAAARKSARIAPEREPESPSLRPASRAAARSAERPAVASTPPTQGATPGYMRTPSRSRRAGRFRPIPTPAHVTPMTFERTYFVTTPGPLAPIQAEDSGERSEARDVFEGLTPQITPFARKLRAGGVTPAPPSAMRNSVFGRSVAGGGTNKSVRFAGFSRFGGGSGGQRRIGVGDE